MPTAQPPTIPPIMPEGVRRSTRMLDRRLRELHRAAHAARRAKTVAQAARVKVEALTARHVHYAQTTLPTVVWYVVTLVAFAVAPVLEFFFDSPTLTYAAATAGVGPEAVQWVRVVVPCVVVAVEGALNVALHHARDCWHDGETGVGPYATWFGVCLSASVFLTALVGASNLPREGDVTAAKALLLVGVCGLATLTHLFLLFGPLEEAKGYVLFAGLRAHHHAQAAAGDGAYERHGRRATELFGRYMRASDTHGLMYPTHPHRPGPFDRVTREIVNDRMGMPVIYGDAGTPNGASAAPPTMSGNRSLPPAAVDTAPTAAATSDSGDQTGELAYLRDVLRQRMRDDESAVTE